MAERSALPVYGNVIKFIQTQTLENFAELGNKPQTTIYTEPEINWKLNFNPDTSSSRFSVLRNLTENIFTITESKEKNKTTDIPFITNGTVSALELLKDTIGKEIKTAAKFPPELAGPNAQFHILNPSLPTPFSLP